MFGQLSDVSKTSVLSTATQFVFVPVKAVSSVIVVIGLVPSMTCCDITTESALVDLTPNLSTALIKNFPTPTNGVTTDVAGLAILGTNTVVF